MKQNWILESRLRLFLDLVAYIAGYKIDTWDIDAIINGLRDTDEERDTWFDYELQGEKRTVGLRLADDPGSSVLHIQITTSPDNASELIDLAFLSASTNP